MIKKLILQIIGAISMSSAIVSLIGIGLTLGGEDNAYFISNNILIELLLAVLMILFFVLSFHYSFLIGKNAEPEYEIVSIKNHFKQNNG